MQIVDLSIVSVYLALCLILGLRHVDEIKNIRDYTLGSGFVPTTSLIATLFATLIGAGTTVGNIEKIHEQGLLFAIGLATFPLVWVTSSKIFTNRVSYFKRRGCMSAGDIMEMLYGKSARWVTNSLSIFMVMGVLAMQGTAIGYLIYYFFGIDKAIGVVIGLGILTAYSALGGIRAVVATDLFQTFVLFIGIPAGCFMAYYELGGYSELIAKLPATHKSFDFTYENFFQILSMMFYSAIPLSYICFIQRFLMAKDKEQLQKAFKLNAFISVPFVIILCMVGFIVKAKAPDIDSNLSFYYLIDNYLPFIVKGLVISGILAAIMSTADSLLNTTSVIIAHDVVKTCFPNMSDKAEIITARASTITLGIIAIFFSLTGNESIVAIEWLVSNFWEPVIMVPIVAGFLGFSTSPTSFATAAICGTLTVLTTRYLTGEFATISLLCGVIASTLGLSIANYVSIEDAAKAAKRVKAYT